MISHANRLISGGGYFRLSRVSSINAMISDFRVCSSITASPKQQLIWPESQYQMESEAIPL